MRAGVEDAAGPGFDPMGGVFVAQFARPEGMRSVNLRTLSPFQRALLVIDGTVTKFIEASTMEPVAVNLISQEHRTLTRDEGWLEAGAGTQVLVRTVLLEGRRTGTLYALAASLLVTERLPGHIESDLATNPGGLGKVLLENHMESRREVLWYGRERIPTQELPEAVRGRSDGDYLSRTYRIIMDGAPVMLVNEKFPASSDALPTHH